MRVCNTVDAADTMKLLAVAVVASVGNVCPKTQAFVVPDPNRSAAIRPRLTISA